MTVGVDVTSTGDYDMHSVFLFEKLKKLNRLQDGGVG